VKRAKIVVFLSMDGSLGILRLDKMTCEQLEDSSIRFNCIALSDDEEEADIGEGGKHSDDRPIVFRLFCGQLDGISCLEVCGQEVRRQSILPIASSNSARVAASNDETPRQEYESSSQTSEITNIIAVNGLLWTSANCTIHLWSVREKHVIRRLDCWKLVPCSESLESINIEQYYQQAKTSSVTSMVYENDQLFVGTSHGCLIIIEASSLKPLTVFRPYERSAIILAPQSPLRGGGNQSSGVTPGRHRQNLVAVGYGYRDLMKRYLSRLDDSSIQSPVQESPVAMKREKQRQQLELAAILLMPTNYHDM
jgi:hypothetical protein